MQAPSGPAGVDPFLFRIVQVSGHPLGPCATAAHDDLVIAVVLAVWWNRRPARVIDGDTIEVAGERIRLHGIDTPESKQTCEWPGKTIPCGRLATLALMDLTAGTEITCKTREKDRYGRWDDLPGVYVRSSPHSGLL